MIDFPFFVRTLNRVQKDMIVKIGEETVLLGDILVGSRPDTVRILKSLFYLVERVPNEKMTVFHYRLNDRGLAALALLREQVEIEVGRQMSA